MTKPPTPKLTPKPLDKEAEKERDKQQFKKQLEASKESIFTEITTKLILERRINLGVGNPDKFYEDLLDGFKATLSAKGIQIPTDLEEQIKTNGGRIVGKENLPKIHRLYGQYGIVPKQSQ